MDDGRRISIFQKYAYRSYKRSIDTTISPERDVRRRIDVEVSKEENVVNIESEEDIDYDDEEDTPYIHNPIFSDPYIPIKINRGYTGRSDFGWERKAYVKQSDLIVRYIAEETDGKKCWIVSKTRIPFVYLWYAKDGWFLLRQVMDVFSRPSIYKRSYYQEHLRKCNIGIEDRIDGCSVISVTVSPFTKMWKELINAGVTTPWCICCETVGCRRCRTIHLINLQAARMFAMKMDAPCKKVFPLLEAIVTLTRDNGRKRALTESDKQRVLMSQMCICAECDLPILDSEGYDVHHKFRVCDGGSNADINLVALHPTCHRKYTERERNRPFTPFNFDSADTT